MWKAESILLSLRGRQAALLVVAQAALVSRPAANAWADDGAALEPGARVAREAEAKAYEDTLQITAQRVPEFGVTFAPAESGPFAYFTGNYIGSRFLNKRNTAPVDGFTTLNAGVGYRVGPWELRVDGSNLTDRRDPISESELGDAQYYRTPGRSFFATLTRTF